MPNFFMPAIPFQSFQTKRTDSIWNQANYACPKLSDSLVIRGKSVDTLTKEETASRIKITGAKGLPSLCKICKRSNKRYRARSIY